MVDRGGTPSDNYFRKENKRQLKNIYWTTHTYTSIQVIPKDQISALSSYLKIELKIEN